MTDHPPPTWKPQRRRLSDHRLLLIKAAAMLVSMTVTMTPVDGFSSIPIPAPKAMNNKRDVLTPSDNINERTIIPPPTADTAAQDTLYPTIATETTSTTTTTTPWRIVLDIGREPLSRMPFDWARSGCRMPLVVPCDFVMKKNDGENTDVTGNNNMVIPKSDTVSFTASHGAVVKPIEGGSWELTYNDIGIQGSKNRNTKLPTGISFSLTFPETLQRRDVYIDGGTTLELSARVYSKQEYDTLNDAYYQAREDTWEMGGKLNDASRRQGAAKKWNEETGRWEKRYGNENLFSIVQNQVKYWSAKARQDAAQRQRPDANDISERGPFPSVDDGLYVAKGGVVRVSNNGPVIGRWSCEPIIDRSLSSNSRKY